MLSAHSALDPASLVLGAAGCVVACSKYCCIPDPIIMEPEFAGLVCPVPWGWGFLAVLLCSQLGSKSVRCLTDPRLHGASFFGLWCCCV